MNRKLRIDAEKAAYTAINAVMPEGAVRRALLGKQFPGRVFLIAAGKAAPRMAQAALSVLTVPVTDGLVISKYGHFDEPIGFLRCFEAGHPVPDENSALAGEAALKLTADLRGLRNACVLCVGSDGTDGPTDAAGGYVDGDTFDKLVEKGISLHETIRNNDAYHALRAVDGLIVTGPTGANVNDLYLGLIDAD